MDPMRDCHRCGNGEFYLAAALIVVGLVLAGVLVTWMLACP
jgi:hypothetical protein